MSLITEKYVEEDYKFSSTNKDEFYHFLAENDLHTKCCRIRSDMVPILALRHDSSFHGDSIPMWKIMPEKSIAIEKAMMVDGKRKIIALNERFAPIDIPKKILMEKGDFNDFVKKIIESKEILFYIDFQVCYLSKRAIPTLCQRIRYDGGHNESSTERANEIAVRMNNMKIPMQAIIKSVNGIGKVYAFMSEKYVPRKLSEIKMLEDVLQTKSSFGKIRFVSGVYNHNECRVVYEFQKIKNLGTPYIEIINSDIGQSSYTITSCWKYENDDVMVNIKRFTISHCHNEISNEDIADAVITTLRDHIRFLGKCKNKYVKMDEKLVEELIKKLCGTVISKRYMRQIINCIKRTHSGQEVELYELLKSITVTPQIYARILKTATQYKLRKNLENAAGILEAQICSG